MEPDKAQTPAVSPPEENSFTATAKWYLDNAMVTGRYSAGLIREFDAHVENRTANIFPIFAEIAALEGAPAAKPSRTKPGGQITGKWLSGLWHKHYTQAHFMRENIMLHWTAPRVRRLNSEMLREQNLSFEETVKKLSHRFVHDGYLERSRNSALTGEWIVYAKQDGVAHYLTMGIHNWSAPLELVHL